MSFGELSLLFFTILFGFLGYYVVSSYTDSLWIIVVSVIVIGFVGGYFSFIANYLNGLLLNWLHKRHQKDDLN